MKREKSTGQKWILAKHFDLKEATFVILKNHASALVRKEKLSPTTTARKKASRNRFVEKGGVPDRIESFREVDSSEDRSRARPGFVKPIRIGLKKEQNLIESDRSGEERENGIRFQKEE